MLKRAKECDAADDMTRYAIIHGLRPELRAYVLQQGPTSTAVAVGHSLLIGQCWCRLLHV